MTRSHLSRISPHTPRCSGIRAILIWGTLSMGTAITVLAIAAIARFEPGTTDRQEAIASLVLFGITPMAAGSWLVWDRRHRRQQAERDRLQRAFYAMVQEGRGCMSVLTFAMETGISGTEARAFLDARSREFQAQFDVTDQGEMIYRFDLGRG